MHVPPISWEPRWMVNLIPSNIPDIKPVAQLDDLDRRILNTFGIFQKLLIDAFLLSVILAYETCQLYFLLCNRLLRRGKCRKGSPIFQVCLSLNENPREYRISSISPQSSRGYPLSGQTIIPLTCLYPSCFESVKSCTN